MSVKSHAASDLIAKTLNLFANAFEIGITLSLFFILLDKLRSQQNLNLTGKLYHLQLYFKST